MRYGIFSDIHGNLEALQTVLDLYRKEGIEDFICLGDIVGYGANPSECLQIVRGLKAAVVAGNHDWAVTGKLNFEYFSPVAKEAVVWTKGQLSEEELSYLNNLSLIHTADDFICVHGTLSEPENFHYLVYMSDAVETFHLMDRPVCFVGHTHAAMIVRQKGDAAECLAETAAAPGPDAKLIVNVGSVGQPRDGDPRASYGLYDTESKQVTLKRTPYDIKTAQDKILKAGLPLPLAERLAIGR